MFRRLAFPRAIGVSIAAGLAACVPALSGCGGGGTSAPIVSPSPIAISRTVMVDCVQGARRASGLLGSAGAALGLSVPTRQEATLQFDDTTGLYFRPAPSGTGFGLNFFEDAAGTKPAGTVTLQLVNATTAKLVFNLPRGQQPMVGTLTLHANDATGTSGTIKGDLSDPTTGQKATFDLAFAPGATAEDTRITGRFSVTDKDGTIAFKNITGGADGALSADIDWNGVPGHLTGNADDSGSLSLGSGADSLRAEWNPEGAGKLILADGTEVAIPDFDTATG